MRRQGFVLPTLVVLLLLGATTGAAPPVAGAACPNEGVRTEQQVGYLPDCRAYEKVSPADKEGYGVIGELTQGAASGNGVAFPSFGAFSGAEGSGAVNMYVASRGATAWHTKNVSPRMDPFFFLNIPAYYAFDPELSKLVLSARTPPQQPGSTAPSATVNMFVRDNLTDRYRLLTTEPAPPDFFGFGGLSYFGAASEGFEEVLLSSPTKYTEDAAEGLGNVFEARADGTFRLVAADAEPGAGISLNTQNSISSDGSRIFYTSPSTNTNTPIGQLYLEDQGAKVHVSAPQRPVLGPDPGGTKPAYFRGAADDGSVVFFTSEEKLTEDATAAEGSPDLYRYDVASEVLSDLTVAPGGGGVLGVSGLSEAGDRIYFVATADLAPGATAGEPNLYLWDGADGDVSFVATLLAGESGNWSSPEVGRTTVRVTPDGSHFAFQTAAPVPGSSNAGHQEVYLFSAADGELECASCSPDGSAATADTVLRRTQSNLTVPRSFVSRNLTDDGRLLFFETVEPLLERDSNGRIDVYAYSRASDEVSLISSGTGAFDSSFANADPNGTNAFFVTQQRLTPWDEDDLTDLYSARVGGGLPDPPQPPPPCLGDGCRVATPVRPAGTAPASAGLEFNDPPLGNRCQVLRAQARKARARARKLNTQSARRDARRLTQKAKRCSAGNKGSK